MKVGIIGGGNIGRTIGQKWASAGHQVIFGVRDPGTDKVHALLEAVGRGARATSVARAIEVGDVLLFAIPHGATPAVVQGNTAALDGKIVIDATNKFAGRPPVNSLAAFQSSPSRITYFRAFNSLGWENFARPVIGGLQIDHFYCGPEGEEGEVVEGLIADVGLRPVRLGDLDQIRLADALGEIWVGLVFRQGYPRRLAFKMMIG